jgi:ArsR family metal-binding transcriptional regulator
MLASYLSIIVSINFKINFTNMVGEMRVNDIEKVLPCIADPWKLRSRAHLEAKPDLPLIAKYVEGKYSDNVGMVVIRFGI